MIKFNKALSSETFNYTDVTLVINSFRAMDGQWPAAWNGDQHALSMDWDRSDVNSPILTVYTDVTGEFTDIHVFFTSNIIDIHGKHISEATP
ncbi:hypothetical protein [Brevibacillus reuszeri]|uniref:hypothetical protein n=1 Tax=Brevibacillus reuszeri TaxID=54915 RepID=UPI000CCBFC0B|nr:hypothetical protein [Brevibacillus reuszeri]